MHQREPLAQRSHGRVAHALVVVRRSKTQLAVEQHHRHEMLCVDVWHRAVVDHVRLDVRQPYLDSRDRVGRQPVLRAQRLRGVERRLDR